MKRGIKKGSAFHLLNGLFTFHSLNFSTLRVTAGVALAAALLVDEGGGAALGAEVADLHG